MPKIKIKQDVIRRTIVICSVLSDCESKLKARGLHSDIYLPPRCPSKCRLQHRPGRYPCPPIASLSFLGNGIRQKARAMDDELTIRVPDTACDTHHRGAIAKTSLFLTPHKYIARSERFSWLTVPASNNGGES